MHVDMGTLRTRLGEAAEAAHVLGLTYVGISSIPADERRTLDGYKRIADEFNQIGARASKRGVRFIYHNHGYGLTELEGQIPLRVVLDSHRPEAGGYGAGSLLDRRRRGGACRAPTHLPGALPSNGHQGHETARALQWRRRRRVAMDGAVPIHDGRR
jgi:hypothetical protein